MFYIFYIGYAVPGDAKHATSSLDRCGVYQERDGCLYCRASERSVFSLLLRFRGATNNVNGPTENSSCGKIEKTRGTRDGCIEAAGESYSSGPFVYLLFGGNAYLW